MQIIYKKFIKIFQNKLEKSLVICEILVYSYHMFKLNLNEISRGAQEENENTVNALCKVKWFSTSKGYGFLLKATKEDLDLFCKSLPNTPSEVDRFTIDNNNEDKKNELLNLFNNESANEISPNKDIFVHGSKLDILQIGNSLSQLDIFYCEVALCTRGCQVNRIISYYTTPREKNEKCCIGSIKFYDVHGDFGFIKPDESEGIKSDIFISGRKIKQTDPNILHAIQNGNPRVKCYYFCGTKGQPVAARLEILQY